MKRNPARGRLKRFYFRIDLRSLGLFRIFLALLLIDDWFLRWPNLEAFYTSFGVLPIDAALPKAGGDFHFSLLDGFLSLGMVKIFFILALFSYVGLVFGYRTKLFQILTLFFFVSISNRNIVIRDGSDLVTACLCFWSVFLPLGERFSIDSLIRRMRRGVNLGLPPPGRKTVRKPLLSEPSFAALGIVLQLAGIYLFSAIDKYAPTWRSGTALYYALHYEVLVRPRGIYFVRHAPFWALKLLTYGTVAAEYAWAPLILFPFWQPFPRRIALAMLTALQLGILSMMDLGHFPLVLILAESALLLPEDWDLIKAAMLRWSKPVTAYYDDTCGFCVFCCQILHLLDSGNNIRWIGNTQKSEFQHDLAPRELEESVVVFGPAPRDKAMKALAFSRIFEALPLPFHGLRVIGLPGFRQFSDCLYDFTARHRHQISSGCGLRSCGLSPAELSPEAPGGQSLSPLGNLTRSGFRLVLNGITAFLVFAVLLDGWNRNVVPVIAGRSIPAPPAMQAPIQIFQLIQDWNMFSPDPTRDTGWWVIDGITESGNHLDPLTGKAPTFEKPPSLSRPYDRLWRKYFWRLWLRDYSDYRLYFGKFITRKNQRENSPGHRLVRFDCYYMLQETLPPGTTEPFPVKKILLWHHECFAT